MVAGLVREEPADGAVEQGGPSTGMIAWEVTVYLYSENHTPPPPRSEN